MVDRSVRRVALLAIHPEYANAILEGRKTVEFRKRALSASIEHVLLYATAPLREIVGAFRVARIDQGSPTAIWKQHGDCGAVSRRAYRDYYSGSPTAVAIVVASARAFDRPLPLDAIPGQPTPPQSFQYLDDDTALDILWSEQEGNASGSRLSHASARTQPPHRGSPRRSAASS
ncbi:MAG: ASCH domain-containing protein [Planctomycetes bacterium]|nr:ASCH domain-containing protein [Planctomycetota bacterium]